MTVLSVGRVKLATARRSPPAEPAVFAPVKFLSRLFTALATRPSNVFAGITLIRSSILPQRVPMRGSRGLSDTVPSGIQKGRGSFLLL